LLLASPEEFGRFWKELIEKASEEQKNAAFAVAPPRNGPDLSVLKGLTEEELDVLERVPKKILQQECSAGQRASERIGEKQQFRQSMPLKTANRVKISCVDCERCPTRLDDGPAI
jgi:hypothetical protein